MQAFGTLVAVLTCVGVAAFAVAGALTASRKELDPVGFILIAAVTAFGGGTARDLMLGVPVFWLRTPEMVGLTVLLAVATFFAAHLVERRFVVLVWADAIGLALFAVLGAEAAQRHGATPWAAVLLGTITATFGGILRDVICGELPLILRREIYATAAALGATVFVALYHLGAGREIAVAAGTVAAFLLRALAIHWGWSLPTYRARPGREYPDKPRGG